MIEGGKDKEDPFIFTERAYKRVGRGCMGYMSMWDKKKEGIKRNREMYSAL